MKRLLSILYTLATVLIIVGALFILQAESYGVAILASGVGLNIVYRIFNLNTERISQLKFSELLKVLGIILMLVACILIFTDYDQKYNMMIFAVVLDVIINYKEITLKTK
ncbi:hypothetical protein [Marinifilum flexuosum]|uniref:Uncharacterized protein n=1 Tax=Marinifilum flexuosum TaxID=1117708 RepID=A0A419X619_9BACT|nr:hypothetical protein [Marinifilum flexuosum]RKE03069.1 hypothetical protein BXY64_0056 [Marinifilum flexuosum]